MRLGTEPVFRGWSLTKSAATHARVIECETGGALHKWLKLDQARGRLLAFDAYLECAAYFAVNDSSMCGGAFAWGKEPPNALPLAELFACRG